MHVRTHEACARIPAACIQVLLVLLLLMRNPALVGSLPGAVYTLHLLLSFQFGAVVESKFRKRKCMGGCTWGGTSDGGPVTSCRVSACARLALMVRKAWLPGAGGW